tara:strand:- start:74 stop:655 length:582 start_codon:yes stop_codon:yes gene_type:complete
MTSILNWLSAAPQGAIAVVTAVLAATIAVFVALLTQWILGRRARTELLTKKLEELYLSLNDVSAHNVKRAEAVLPYVKTGVPRQLQSEESSVEKQALDLHKKILMQVRLYFPKLSIAHQNVFRRNREVNDLIHRLESGVGSSEETLIRLSGAYGDALRQMEQEIITNKSILVRDGLLPRIYRKPPNKSRKADA